MGYVSDWDQWATAAAEARAAHPRCNGKPSCSAGADPDEHMTDCWLRHRGWRIGRALTFLYRVPHTGGDGRLT